MRLDPFTQGAARHRLVGIIVVAAEEVDLQVRRLAQARDLVPTLRHRSFRRCAILGGGSLVVAGGLRGEELDVERLDRSRGACRGLPV